MNTIRLILTTSLLGGMFYLGFNEYNTYFYKQPKVNLMNPAK